MAIISRKELLAEILPALNEMFGTEYKNYHRNLIGGNNAIHGLAPIELNPYGVEDALHEKPSSL